jgi:hypothetical protein
VAWWNNHFSAFSQTLPRPQNMRLHFVSPDTGLHKRDTFSTLIVGPDPGPGPPEQHSDVFTTQPSTTNLV